MASDVAVCARILLRAGALPRVREWAAHIARHHEEARQTLSAEGVTIESVFLDSSAADGDYLVYYMRAASHAQAQEVARRSTAEIDRYHRAFKQDAWARVDRLELLVDLRAEPGVPLP